MILKEYLTLIQEDDEIITEGIFLSLFLGYIVFMIIAAMFIDRNNKQVMELVKQILPLVKKDIENLQRKATPKVVAISKQLHGALSRVKGDDLIVLKTYAFYLWSNKNRSVSVELKSLLNTKLIQKSFVDYITNTVKTSVEKFRKEKRRVKIVTYVYDRSFFIKFNLHAIDDSWEALPNHMTQDISDSKLQNMYGRIDKIINAHDKKVIALCNDFFKSVEKIVNDYINKNDF